MITHRLVIKHLYLGRPPKTYCGILVSRDNIMAKDKDFVVHNNFDCEECLEEFGLSSLANIP